MKYRFLKTVCCLVLTTVSLTLPAQRAERPLKATLNKLQLEIDGNTGCILRMSYPGVGTILESKADYAGMIDLACPVKEFEVLRMGSRHSAGAQVRIFPDSVVIHWDNLGMSRAGFSVGGKVSAAARLAADPDGQSVILTATISNYSGTDVRQVIFPDLQGMLPVNGKENTNFRTGNFATLPFIDLAKDDAKESTPYMIDAASGSVQYVGSGMMKNKDMIVRWMDLGGLGGGVSLFPKRWGWDPQVPVRLQLSEPEAKLRLMCLNDTVIKRNEVWESGEWVLTPHKSGWAAGIAPYKRWVKQNCSRYYPLPKHVREGIGFRSVFMSQYQPADPKDAIFTFRDLPELAAECKENGLDEMVIWAWCEAFALPLPKPFAHLGTEQEMSEAAVACRKLGVNLVPFITVLQANKKTAPRYGLEVTGSKGWTYHTELIPFRNPGYATYMSTVQAGPTNKRWQSDVLEGLTRLANLGITSFCWDQFFTTPDPEPNMISLAKHIIDQSKKRDPESTFSGEELLNFELDAAYLDYTWNWDGYMDRKALTSAFPSPRINSCISSSPLAVKKAFADNLYMNIMPRRAESTNGSGYISGYPEMGKALRQCASLKKQFLPYFLDGNLLGDCLLTKPAADAHVCAYALPDRAILVLINTSSSVKTTELHADLSAWLNPGTENYTLKHFNEDGKIVSETTVPKNWQGSSLVLQPNEMEVLEFIGKK